jgi:hypothetical protein
MESTLNMPRRKNQKEPNNSGSLSEKAMSFLEEHIPELASVASKQAYWTALASGSSVLIIDILPRLKSGGFLSMKSNKNTQVFYCFAPSISALKGRA